MVVPCLMVTASPRMDTWQVKRMTLEVDVKKREGMHTPSCMLLAELTHFFCPLPGAFYLKTEKIGPADDPGSLHMYTCLAAKRGVNFPP